MRREIGGGARRDAGSAAGAGWGASSGGGSSGSGAGGRLSELRGLDAYLASSSGPAAAPAPPVAPPANAWAAKGAPPAAAKRAPPPPEPPRMVALTLPGRTAAASAAGGGGAAAAKAVAPPAAAPAPAPAPAPVEPVQAWPLLSSAVSLGSQGSGSLRPVGSGVWGASPLAAASSDAAGGQPQQLPQQSPPPQQQQQPAAAAKAAPPIVGAEQPDEEEQKLTNVQKKNLKRAERKKRAAAEAAAAAGASDARGTAAAASRLVSSGCGAVGGRLEEGEADAETEALMYDLAVSALIVRRTLGLVQSLQRLGLPEWQAAAAVQRHGSDLEAGLTWLLGGGADDPAAAAAAVTGSVPEVCVAPEVHEMSLLRRRLGVAPCALYQAVVDAGGDLARAASALGPRAAHIDAGGAACALLGRSGSFAGGGGGGDASGSASATASACASPLRLGGSGSFGVEGGPFGSALSGPPPGWAAAFSGRSSPSPLGAPGRSNSGSGAGGGGGSSGGGGALPLAGPGGLLTASDPVVSLVAPGGGRGGLASLSFRSQSQEGLADVPFGAAAAGGSTAVAATATAGRTAAGSGSLLQGGSPLFASSFSSWGDPQVPAFSGGSSTGGAGGATALGGLAPAAAALRGGSGALGGLGPGGGGSSRLVGQPQGSGDIADGEEAELDSLCALMCH
jgi:hypothetical protein